MIQFCMDMFTLVAPRTLDPIDIVLPLPKVAKSGQSAQCIELWRAALNKSFKNKQNSSLTKYYVDKLSTCKIYFIHSQVGFWIIDVSLYHTMFATMQRYFVYFDDLFCSPY